MSVNKLRSLKEAEDRLWRDPKDPATWRVIDGLWRFGSRFTQPLPRGVRKFESIEAANAARRASRAR